MPRPYVICHMCTSIDGRIIPSRWGTVPGVKNAGGLFETTAATFGIGAWIVGTTTLKEFSSRPFKLRHSLIDISREDFIANASTDRLAIGIDPRGQTFWKHNEVAGDHVVLLLTRQVSNDYLAHLRTGGVSYLFCGRDQIDLALALEKLHSLFKLKKVMLQGGGRINGSFLKAGLIDEISQVIIPVADGGMGIPSFFDIPGPAPKSSAAALRVIKHSVLRGKVHWFRYRVVTRHAARTREEK